MPRPKLPRYVRVGVHTYRIVRKTKEQMPNPENEMGHDVGICHPDRLEIWILRSFRGSLLQDTLLHEVGHACLADSPLADTKPENPDEYEEFFMKAITPMLLQVLQENPELVLFLTHKEAHGRRIRTKAQPSVAGSGGQDPPAK